MSTTTVADYKNSCLGQCMPVWALQLEADVPVVSHYGYMHLQAFVVNT